MKACRLAVCAVALSAGPAVAAPAPLLLSMSHIHFGPNIWRFKVYLDGRLELRIDDETRLGQLPVERLQRLKAIIETEKLLELRGAEFGTCYVDMSVWLVTIHAGDRSAEITLCTDLASEPDRGALERLDLFTREVEGLLGEIRREGDSPMSLPWSTTAPPFRTQ